MLLKDVAVKWVYANRPDKFGKLTVVCDITDEQAEELKAQGLKVTERDGKPEFKFSKNPVSKKGETNTMDFYDRYGEEFEGQVPNGTKCDISYRVFEWEFNGRKGVSAWMVGAKILGDVMAASGDLTFDKEPVVTDDSPF